MKTVFPIGRMAPAILEAVKRREKLIASGTSESDASRIAGEDLRAAWGSDRTEPWHYYCEKCCDSGMVVVKPTYFEMQRLIRLYGPNPVYQDYMAPCDPCSYREREREKRRHVDETQTRSRNGR